MEIDDDALQAVVKAMIANQAMDDQAAYLSRGRAYASLPLEELMTLWTEASKAFFFDPPKVRCTPMDDFAAELALRGETPPYSRMPLEIDSIRMELRSQPDGHEAIWGHIHAFLELMANPKH